MIIAIILVIVIGGMVIINFIPRVTVTTEKPPEPEPFDAFEVEYTLIGESIYDPALFYDKLGYIKGSDCTEYEIIGDPGGEHFTQLSEDMKFDMPDGLNYEQYSHIISYGRRIVDLEAIEKNGSYYVLSITFEGDYQGNKVYFYQMNRMSIYLSHYLFIMKGNEKIPYGTMTRDMNEIDLEHPRYKGAK